MKAKPVVPRRVANRDVDGAITYYLEHGSEQSGLGFIAALEKAYAHISRYPATGSARYSNELSIPGLRHWPLARFPHLVFYLEREDHIDVWRVLHAHRDIPSWMHAPEG